MGGTVVNPDDPLDGNPYDMDAHEIATTMLPTEIEEDEEDD